MVQTAKLRVMVLMGGKTPEHDVSLVTGRGVVQDLDKRKYKVLPVVISPDGEKWQLKSLEKFLLQSTTGVGKSVSQKKIQDYKKKLGSKRSRLLPQLKAEKPDVVFLAMHGPFGEDGTIQGMLELAGVPYTGAGVLASALGMDKIMFRKVMLFEGLSMSDCLVFGPRSKKAEIFKKFKFPFVVKPSNQGSSVGISIVHKKNELNMALKAAFGYSRKILIEEYLPGTEVTCGVLGNDKPIPLPLVEIIPKNEFFDYEAKYQADSCEEIVPARISKRLTKQVQDLAVRVFEAIGCRGFGRVDFIISRGKPYVLEINTIPGLTPNSLLPQEAAAAGISYSRLLDRVIELALEK